MIRHIVQFPIHIFDNNEQKYILRSYLKFLHIVPPIVTSKDKGKKFFFEYIKNRAVFGCFNTTIIPGSSIFCPTRFAVRPIVFLLNLDIKFIDFIELLCKNRNRTFVTTGQLLFHYKTVSYW